VLQHDLPLAVAADRYLVLAVGDGLVAQIPALVISTAAGLLVSRVAGAGSEGEDIGRQLARQLFTSPQSLAITAAVLALLGAIPGMPNAAFLAFAAVAGAGAWGLHSRRVRAAAPQAAPAPAPEATELSWDDVVPVDVLGLEVGYRLVPLVDRAQGGELLRRIRGVRRKFAQEVGFLPAAVHIRDNLELRPGGYRVLLKGVVVAEGEVHPGQYLAIDPGGVQGTLAGTPVRDPAFGLPAVWIDAAQRESALAQGWTVVDASSVVATHVSQVLYAHAAALLGRAETQALIDQFARHAPKLVEDVVPKVVALATVQRVLQNLLEEGLHVRDLRTILETLAEQAGRSTDPAELTTAVRVALGPSIAQQVFGAGREVQVIALEPELERLLAQSFAAGEALEPGLAEVLARSAAAAAERLESLGQPPVLVVEDRLRAPLARLLRRALPRLRVLAHGELPGERIVRVLQTLGAAS